MARHFTERIALQDQTCFFIVRKLFVDEEAFYDAKMKRGVNDVDVREQTVQLRWSTASGRFECRTGNSAIAVTEYNMANSYVVPVGMFSLHSTRFESFAAYDSFFDAFPSIQVFKAAFLTCITLPALPTVSDYMARMSRENENAHLLGLLAERLPVTEEPVE